MVLLNGDDELLPWARGHSMMFQNPDEDQLATVQSILEVWPKTLGHDE